VPRIFVRRRHLHTNFIAIIIVIAAAAQKIRNLRARVLGLGAGIRIPAKALCKRHTSGIIATRQRAPMIRWGQQCTSFVRYAQLFGDALEALHGRGQLRATHLSSETWSASVYVGVDD
jgi:hypothetical protein